MKDRIIAFCEAEKISRHAFLSAAGLAGSTLTTFGNGIRSDKLAKIALAYPQLDIRWLLTGEGGMYSRCADAAPDEEWYRRQLELKDEQIAVLGRLAESQAALLEERCRAREPDKP